MQTIRIIEGTIPLADVVELARETYTTMIKGSVDVSRGRVAIGGDYHIESCEELTRTGSVHGDVWGFNIVFTGPATYDIEYDSLINIKPAIGNRSRTVQDEALQTTIRQILETHITP